MNPMQSSALIEWAVATRLLPGQQVSGDSYVVQGWPEGVILAAVDGLGHGREAAQAARRAIQLVKRHSRESVIALLKRCHEGLRRTRGAVMSIGTLHRVENTLTWAGVGDVEGVLIRAGCTLPDREHLLRRPGVLGDRHLALSASVVPVARGDLLILATDGIWSAFAAEFRPQRDQTAQKMADAILASYVRDMDDALVLVARYLGERKRSQVRP